MTEATCVSSLNPRDGHRAIGSIGLRLPYQQMKVAQLGADGEPQRDAAVDEIGTILLRGPYVFSGYVKDSDNKGICLADGWLSTGDLGRQDAQGYFWLTGRRVAKDQIIRGGHNIDPKAMIEEGLMRHPAVEHRRRRSASPTAMPANCRWPTSTLRQGAQAAMPPPSCLRMRVRSSPSAPPCRSTWSCSMRCRSRR